MDLLSSAYFHVFVETLAASNGMVVILSENELIVAAAFFFSYHDSISSSHLFRCNINNTNKNSHHDL